MARETRFAPLVFSLTFSLLFSPLTANAAEPSSSPSVASANALRSPPLTADKLGDCNWMVTYRGRTFDLSPLTREALSRPIETDIRYALQRVPQANEHLLRMTSFQKDAKAHTLLASIFLGGLLLTRFAFQAREKNTDRRREYDVLIGATGGFFVAATFFSWKATVNAKDELVKAVDAFNESSPHKIEPASAGARESELFAPGTGL